MGIQASYRALWNELSLTTEQVFTDPRIVVWRDLRERQNATLATALADGRAVRLHIKRYQPAMPSPAEQEARGIQLLMHHGIPTVPLVAWETLADGRGYIVTEELYGFQAADKLVEAGLPFERLLEPTAKLAARLHAAGLHHRDLYLCHFFAKATMADPELRLIDAGRVKELPGWLTRWRWIVKDLAQFRYSTYALPVENEQRERWLRAYELERQASVRWLRRSIRQKTLAIARHDQRLRAKQPGRNISIP